MNNEKQLPDLPDEFLLRTFEGQTVFSIALHDFTVYEKLMDKLKQSLLKEDEAEQNGREDDSKARAIQIVKLPT